MNVFVHLAHGFGAANWRVRHAAGTVIGINEIPAYGYARAASAERHIVYSEDQPEGKLTKLARLGIRAILGFDFVHALRNRRGILASDVVWTHTESQYLSILLMLAFVPASRRPRVIAQTVWLIDQWDGLFVLKRWFYKALMRRADALTFLSPLNLSKAQTILPRARCEFVRFGIKADDLVHREPRTGGPVRILAVGNDRHRDWASLIAATGGWDCEVKIVSGVVGAEALRDAPNLSIVRPRSNAELFALYDWADLLVVTLKPNLHASGITVIEEAVTRSLPVVASRVGGLEHYFAADEISLLDDNGVGSIRGMVQTLYADPRRRAAMAAKAQERVRAGLSSTGYAMHHVAISQDLLRETVSVAVDRYELA